MSEPLCECGHPKEAHPVQLPLPPLRDPCRATIYREKPGGMDAWPCPCQRFRPLSAEAAA